MNEKMTKFCAITAIELIAVIFAAGCISATSEGPGPDTMPAYNLHPEIIIDSVWNASGNINLSVRNSGSWVIPNISESNVYVNGIAVSAIGWGNETFAPKDVRIIELVGTLFPAAETSKTIRIMHKTGAQTVYRCSATAEQILC